MSQRSRNGKSSELIVAGELLRYGLDVYLPLVDDRAIDMIVRQPMLGAVKHYDIQVKSVSGYNRIIGLAEVASKSDNYILVIYYRHAKKPDECFYLLRHQILLHHLAESHWGDVVLNKAEREKYGCQTLKDLSEKIDKNAICSG
jgi:hypothetical protein